MGRLVFILICSLNWAVVFADMYQEEKQLNDLVKGIFARFKAGKSIKMNVNLKNPEELIKSLSVPETEKPDKEAYRMKSYKSSASAGQENVAGNYGQDDSECIPVGEPCRTPEHLEKRMVCCDGESGMLSMCVKGASESTCVVLEGAYKSSAGYKGLQESEPEAYNSKSKGDFVPEEAYKSSAGYRGMQESEQPEAYNIKSDGEMVPEEAYKSSARYKGLQESEPEAYNSKSGGEMASEPSYKSSDSAGNEECIQPLDTCETGNPENSKPCCEGFSCVRRPYLDLEPDGICISEEMKMKMQDMQVKRMRVLGG